jgi:hypothetical protein
MAKIKKTFTTLPAGTSVTWHYRSAIGHGTVVGYTNWEPPQTLRCMTYGSMTIILANRRSCITPARH